MLEGVQIYRPSVISALDGGVLEDAMIVVQHRDPHGSPRSARRSDYSTAPCRAGDANFATARSSSSAITGLTR